MPLGRLCGCLPHQASSILVGTAFAPWGGMYQGGELHLQCGCGRFDSGPLHHLTAASVAKWQGTRLQSANRGFDSRPMLAARWLGRWIGLGSSKPDGGVRFPGELHLEIASISPPYVDVTRASEARCAGSNPAGGTRARVVQWSRTARFQCASAGSIPAASTGPGRRGLRGADTGPENRVARKRPGSTPAPSAISDRLEDRNRLTTSQHCL
jgi:hypothetical protein